MKAIKVFRFEFLPLILLLPGAMVVARAEDSAPPLDRIARRALWLQKQRAFPLEDVPENARTRALARIKELKASASLVAGGGGFKWFSIGPAPIDDGVYAASGRVTAIAVDPLDMDHWLIGGAQGGVWETWDSGVNWTPRTDDQPSLATGAIAFAPGNPKVIYVGTGEGNFAFTAYAGAGLLKSINRGTNWFVLAEAQFSRSAISDIKVHESNPNILMAATTRAVLGRGLSPVTVTNNPPGSPARGIFKSTNGGTNWTQKLIGEATDIEVDTNNFGRQYAALGEVWGHASNGVYRSTSSGDTWTRIDGPWAPQIAITNVGRIELAIAPSNPNTVYVAVARKRGVTPALLGIWRTDNAWAGTPTWTELTSTSTADNLWYYLELAVDPNNPGVLYLGELNLKRYVLGSWTSITGTMHSDQHALVWAGSNPIGPRLVVGNDGGVWVSSYGVGSFANRNAGLALTQFYDGSVHPTDSDLAIGGSQDNGTERFTGDPVWTQFRDSDGGDTAISASHPEIHWALATQVSDSSVNILRTKDGGVADFVNVTQDVPGKTAPFLVRFEKHPSLDDHFIVGTANLWHCTNFFSATSPSWSSNSPPMVATNGGLATISALAFAPSDILGRTYAFGTEDGQLRITSDAGTNWANLDPSNTVPGRYISGLAFDPTSANILYVTLSGFDEGTPAAPGHVFQTTNALSLGGPPAWTNISYPVNIPANIIAVNPTFSSQLYVGTDIGVWQSNDAGQTWNHYGPESGMPNVAVFDLQMNSFGTPTAFTHGRGAFVLKLQIPEIVETACPVFPCQFYWINPGDLVSIIFPLRSIITADTVDLKARLRQTSEITPKSEAKSYGKLSVNGPGVGQSFSFVAGGGAGGNLVAGSRCGDTVQAILDLEDGGVSLGSVTFNLRLGRPSVPLAENFEQVTPPELPGDWRASLTGAGEPWASTTNHPPNSLPGGDPDEPIDIPGPRWLPPNNSVFAPSPDGSSDNMLYSPPIPIGSNSAQLIFRHSFDFERGVDGGVLEIAIGTGPFEDIERAQGIFTDSGYNATLRGGAFAGRRGWSGDSGGYLITHVDLPAAAAGRSIQLRWRSLTDSSIGGEGWHIDDVRIEQFECLNPVSDPVIIKPRLVRDRLAFSFATVAGRNYIVECKNALEDRDWELLEILGGDGSEQTSSVEVSSSVHRFYRFRVD